MFRTRLLSLFPVSLALLVAAGQPWKDKTVAEWNEDDTRLILNDSPWAKSAEPTVDRSAAPARPSRGMGRVGGIGIGLPGMGGMGRHGGGSPGGQSGSATPDTSQPTSLHLRWESALPVRAAEMKAREANSPTFEDDQYAIAVYGVPDRIVAGNPEAVGSQLKKQAVIKRDGKSDLKPSEVDVLQRDDGTVVVYLFPRSKEITRQDKRIEFDATIGRLKFTTEFLVDDMMYQGKLEL